MTAYKALLTNEQIEDRLKQIEPGGTLHVQAKGISRCTVLIGRFVGMHQGQYLILELTPRQWTKFLSIPSGARFLVRHGDDDQAESVAFFKSALITSTPMLRLLYIRYPGYIQTKVPAQSVQSESRVIESLVEGKAVIDRMADRLSVSLRGIPTLHQRVAGM